MRPGNKQIEHRLVSRAVEWLGLLDAVCEYTSHCVFSDNKATAYLHDE